MKKKRLGTQPKNCPSCGAPVVSEICAYCGTPTGLNTAAANMEYPVLECKEATVNFWTLWFPMIFAAAFGFPGLLVVGIGAVGFGEWTMLMIGAPFLMIGLVAFVLALRTALRHAAVKKHGKIVQATVYGYLDDSVMLNDRPAQIVKLLVQTSDGPRFILYELGNTLKPYGINDRVEMMVYQDKFLICENVSAIR